MPWPERGRRRPTRPEARGETRGFSAGRRTARPCRRSWSLPEPTGAKTKGELYDAVAACIADGADKISVAVEGLYTYLKAHRTYLGANDEVGDLDLTAVLAKIGIESDVAGAKSTASVYLNKIGSYRAGPIAAHYPGLSTLWCRIPQPGSELDKKCPHVLAHFARPPRHRQLHCSG